MAGAAVKTNPLLVQVHGGSWGEGGAVEMSAFYGQRRNIRKTKEQEMISAIMELAHPGIYNASPAYRDFYHESAQAKLVIIYLDYYLDCR